MKNMFDSLKSESQIRIVHIPHETLPKRIITFQPLIGKTWNILDVKSQFFHDIHSGEKKILI